MTALEIKLIALAALLAACLVGYAFWHHKVILEGEAKIKASDAIAVAKQVQAVAAQKVADQKVSEDVVTSLNTELSALRSQLGAPSTAPSVVCRATRRTGPLSAPSTAPGGLKPPNASPGDMASVPSGPGNGPDIEQGLRLIATTAGIAAAYQHACATWALKEASP